MCKWTLYVRRQLDRYYRIKEEFIKARSLPIRVTDQIPPGMKEDWSQRSYHVSQPQIREHKMSIYIWIAYWPFSMVWTVINDPIRRLVKWIYRRIESSLQAISDRVWSKAREDF